MQSQTFHIGEMVAFHSSQRPEMPMLYRSCSRMGAARPVTHGNVSQPISPMRDFVRSQLICAVMATANGRRGA